ncbi:MAG: hypothetical protein IKK10_05090 [Clostridia bacterium]|nr:hypothetical protein [Clostridia bacterium]
MLKRIVSLVISLVMIIGCAGAFSAGAESSGQAAVTAGDTKCTVNAGDEIVYTARLDYKKGIDNAWGYVSYNPESLVYVEEKRELCVPNFEQPTIFYRDGEGKITFNASAFEQLCDFSQNQVLVTLRFKVKSAVNSELKIYFNELSSANGWMLVKDGTVYDRGAVITEFVSSEPQERYLEIVHNGETFKAKVGDVVTYTLYLKAPEKIRHLSAGVLFDYNYLWAEENGFKDRYPNLFEGSDQYVGNGQMFSGTVAGKGFATSKYEVLATYNLNVLSEGKTKIDVTYELYNYDDDRYSSLDDNKVKLKSEITLKKSEDSSEKAELLGDANGNGEVNIKDATTVQKASAKLITLDENAKLCSDVNSDGKVNVKDATAIQKYLAKINTGYDIGKPLKNK